MTNRYFGPRTDSSHAKEQLFAKPVPKTNTTTGTTLKNVIANRMTQV